MINGLGEGRTKSGGSDGFGVLFIDSRKQRVQVNNGEDWVFSYSVIA